MESWLIYTLIGIGVFIVSLFFESARDFYTDCWEFISDIFSDILGDFGEGIIYIISFEWIKDIPEFFGTMFEDLSDFSVYGLAFAMFAVGLIYFTRDYMIAPFMEYYGTTGKIFWTIATYSSVFIAGYFLGKFFENSG